MPTYKGNVGNLMQHWTLCELLQIAQQRGVLGLNFIDAHTMAPRATENKGKDPKFTRAEARLQQGHGPDHEWASKYEWAWHHLTPSSSGYPNSAAFVNQVWKGDFSLLLCETNESTIGKLKRWCEGISKLKRCTSRPELHKDDWRERFDKKLPRPSDVGLLDGSLTIVSFDPYKYDWHRHRYQRRNETDERLGTLYPQDIERTVCALQGNPGQVLVQLSTYSANGANSQGAVISSVHSILSASGFTLCAVVRVDGNMMSLVYTRNVSWSAKLANLPDRFADWIRRV